MIMPENKNDNRARNQQPVGNTYAHVQPQAVDVEKAILGALMIDCRAYAVVNDILRPDSFYDSRHQKIYEAVRDLAEADNPKPVDILTVAEQLAKNGTLEDVGGPGYITELSSRVASSANIERHAMIVAEKALARELIKFADDVQKKAFDETTDVDGLLQESEENLFELNKYIPDNVIKTIYDSTADANKFIQAAAASPDGITGIPSFGIIDEVTAGFQEKDIIIVGARPAMGKTAFALSLAKNIAIDYNIPVAFFSLEMDHVQLALRLISNVCEIPGKSLQTGRLTRDEWDRYEKRLSLLLDAPMYIDDTPGLSVGAFRSKARKLVREKGVKVIFVDYLQLMHYTGKRFNTRQEEVSEISRSLKGIAKELNVPIVALSQVSRESSKREGLLGKRPQLSDLRESDAIAQDADIVILLHRPEYYNILQDEKGNSLIGVAEIIIAKHRKGATKTAPPLKMLYRKEYTRFDDEEHLTNHNQNHQDSSDDSNNNGPLPF